MKEKKLIKLAEKGDAEAAFELAWEKLGSKDIAGSIEWVRKAAVLGYRDPGGEETIGMFYLPDTAALSGDPSNETEALFWLNRAIKDGSSEALADLAFFYKSHPNAPREAGAPTPLELNRQAAERGQVTSQIAMGAAYLSGEGVPKDPAEAERWFARADQAADPGTELQIGTIYEGRDAAKSIEYLRKAAAEPATGQYFPMSGYQQGAYHQLGEIHRDGKGVPPNAALAQLCFDAEKELSDKQNEAQAAFHAETQASIAESQERIRASQQAFLPNLAAAVVGGLSAPPNQIAVAGQQQVNAINEIAARDKTEQARRRCGSPRYGSQRIKKLSP